MTIDEISVVVRNKIGATSELFKNSQALHMRPDSPNRKTIIAVSQLTRKGMLEYKAKLFGEVPPPQLEHLFSDRVYELLSLRNAIELELLKGLKNAEAELESDKCKDMPPPKKEFLSKVLKEKGKVFTYLIEDLLWY